MCDILQKQLDHDIYIQIGWSQIYHDNLCGNICDLGYF